MTSNTKEDLEEFRKSLSPYEEMTLDELIKTHGEEHVISILGHLKNDFEVARHL